MIEWFRDILGGSRTRLRLAQGQPRSVRRFSSELAAYLQEHSALGEHIEQVSLRDEQLLITVHVPSQAIEVSDSLRFQAEKVLKHTFPAHKLPRLVWIATRKAHITPPPSHPTVPPAGTPQAPHGHGKTGGTPRESKKILLPHIKHIIAVSAAKGGVGKSTVSVGLALAMRARGLRVGLLDADVYGPSLPHMLGISQKAVMLNKSIAPLEAHGLKMMSVGAMIDAEAPLIWRGPMVMGAFEQMLRDVEWGDLDILVIDMPPGTGDIQLTLAQRVTLDGAVIVSTPQDLALLDVRRGMNMFKKVNIPILGMIENMSHFICGTCETVHYPFGHHGVLDLAQQRDITLLGTLPLVLEVRTAGDSGVPFMVSHKDHPLAGEISNISEKIWNLIDRKAA